MSDNSFIHKFLFCICFFATCSLASEQVNTKSISAIATGQIDEYLEQAENIRTSDFKRFVNKLEILEGYKSRFTINQSCYYNFLLAYQLGFSGNFHKANQTLHSLFKQCDDLRIRVRIKALLANLAVISGDYQKAIENLDYPLSHVDELTDKATKHIVQMVAFIVYNIVGQDELSLKFSEMMIQDGPSDVNLCKAKVHKYRALMIQEPNIDYSQEINNTISECKNINQNLYAQFLNVSWLQFQLEHFIDTSDFSALLEQLLIAEGEIENTQYENLISIKNSLLGQLYEKLNQPEKAKFYASESIKGSISIGDTDQKIEALQVLINYHQNKAEYKEANKYLVEKNRSENKFYTDKQAKLMAFQTIKHNNLANTYKINALSQENKLLQLSNKLAEKSRRNQELLNILYGITVFFFAIFAYRLTKQQRKFKRLSEYDHMTMVFNRKGIKEYMEYLLPYAEKKNEIVAYVIFDLDFFKRVNDVYGHVVGDWVIKHSIEVCKELNNEKAVFSRLGGEEFSIVIRDSSIDEAVAFSDRCRKAINAINTLDGSKHDFEVSASFGITTSEISGYDYTKLMTHADNALYYSKENGRNRITVFHPYTVKQ